MGDIFGGGNTTSTTTTKGGKTTSSSAVSLPEWYETHVKSGLSRAAGAADRPYMPYDPNSRVAGLTPDHTSAFDMTRDAAGQWRPALGRAGELANPTAENTAFYGQAMAGTDPNDWRRSMDTATGSTRTTGPGGETQIGFEKFSPESVQQYMDPYIGNVLDRAAQEYTRNRSINRQGISDAAHKAGAFGGSRHGVVESEYDRNTGQDLSDIYTTGLSAAYDRATGQREAERQALFNEEGMNQAALQGKGGASGALAQIGSDRLARNLQSSGALSQLGTTSSALGYGDADAQRAIGDIQRDVGQGTANAAYEEFLRGEQFPYDQASWYSGITSGAQVPRTQSTITKTPNTTSTSTSPGPNTAGQIIGGGLGLLGGLLSSEDYKKDFKKSGRGEGLKMIREMLGGGGLSKFMQSLGGEGMQPRGGALAKISALPVKDYNYKDALTKGGVAPAGRRMGPMAEDWASMFGGDGKSIDIGNAVGALTKAVQELDTRTKRRKAA